MGSPEQDGKPRLEPDEGMLDSHERQAGDVDDADTGKALDELPFVPAASAFEELPTRKMQALSLDDAKKLRQQGWVSSPPKIPAAAPTAEPQSESAEPKSESTGKVVRRLELQLQTAQLGPEETARLQRLLAEARRKRRRTAVISLLLAVTAGVAVAVLVAHLNASPDAGGNSVVQATSDTAPANAATEESATTAEDTARVPHEEQTAAETNENATPEAQDGPSQTPSSEAAPSSPESTNAPQSGPLHPHELGNDHDEAAADAALTAARALPEGPARIVALEQAARIGPRNPHIAAELAEAHLEARPPRGALALEWAEYAVRLRRRRARYRLLLADVYTHLGRHAEARAARDEAADLR